MDPEGFAWMMSTKTSAIPFWIINGPHYWFWSFSNTTQVARNPFPFSTWVQISVPLNHSSSVLEHVLVNLPALGDNIWDKLTQPPVLVCRFFQDDVQGNPWVSAEPCLKRGNSCYWVYICTILAVLTTSLPCYAALWLALQTSAPRSLHQWVLVYVLTN